MKIEEFIQKLNQIQANHPDAEVVAEVDDRYSKVPGAWHPRVVGVRAEDRHCVVEFGSHSNDLPPGVTEADPV